MFPRGTSTSTVPVLAALAAVVSACDVQRNPGTGVDNPVAQVIVAPATVTLDPFANNQFEAFGRTQAGDSVPVTVRWSASAGPVTSGGMYTADTSAADAVVTATLTSAPLTGSARVKKRQVIQIVLNPETTTLLAGSARQFTVYGRRNTGDSVSVSVAYTATGGAIAGGGAYTAGQTAGTYRVIAKQSGGSLADTSVVTVTVVPVASVTVSPAAPSVEVGQTVQLAATPEDANGNALSGRVVTWATSAAAVATVNGSGLVTSVAAGSATITATSEGQSGTTAVTVTAPAPVASVTVSPATASLVVGGTQQLTATLRDAGGNVLTGRVVTWATSAAAVATVNGSGLVTSVAAGSATITATSEGRSGTTAVTVTAPAPAPVASVAVSPATVSLVVGGTQQLTATLRDASGNVLTGRVVTWASSNALVGSVSGTGLVSALLAGGATMTATSEGRSGSAAVTITAPSGGTILVQDDFEDTGFGARGWYDVASTPTLTDTVHIAGSTRALEVRFRAGATTPSWGLARRLFPSSPTVYVSYWVKYSPNWVGSRQLYHPHEFQIMSDLDGDYAALANSWMEAYVEHNYQNGGIPRLSIQDSRAINTSYGAPPINLIGITENRSIGGCNGLSETYVVASCFSFPPWYNSKEITAPQVWFKPSPGPGYKGNWNHVEAYFQVNSIVGGIGQADGVAQYWFNGTLVIDRHDVMFRTGARPTIKFHQFVMAPYIGDGSPVDQTMWIDNLLVMTAKP